MSIFVISVSQDMAGRAEQLYAILADYRVGHPAIVPKQYFRDLKIEDGGTGAGTVFRLELLVMGQTFKYHQRVSEPQPGRVLKETDIDTGLSTTFTVEPLGDGTQSRVTISTEFKGGDGIGGAIQKFLTRLLTTRMYNEELRNLAAYAQKN
ncbi:MAG: SRPBCC family protein [Chloroflexi bacterium]|nr:SRPBCC family protein [Chloroflexota bacterium]